ncbi:MAG: efflux RND transporter periplasmic adaptor subunit [Lachnospiraceae bacterium]|nr:efflux RND transporter periplasmic adaptor subunit [Lachnospiraceae bacterium]
MKKGTKTAIIIIAAAAVITGGFFAARHFLAGGGKSGGDDVAYVDTVANFMGISGSGGMINRFAGVVESQETWSVNQNQEYTVEEIFVTVGQEVKEGDPLFKYDIEKFQSDLTQAEIDLERLNNEMTSMVTIKEQLEKDMKKASSSEKANYTIQIQEQELNIKQKQIDIDTKQLDIGKLHENIEHATVASGLTGVVKSINKDGSANMGYGGSEEDNAFITIMQVGDFRVKGTINEQNMYDIYSGEPVIVYSRADKTKTWRGTIDRIDTENTVQQQNYYYGGDSGNQSSKYPFYVQLDDSTGLMLGQHVYMEPDLGQGEEEKKGLGLAEYLIDRTDPDHPFVWKEEDGKLVKQELQLGEYDEELMQYEVLSGLTAEDRIAFPAENLREGMATADMAEMNAMGGEEMPEDGMMPEEEYMPDEEMMPEEGVMTEEMMPEEGVMTEEMMPEEGGVG